MEKLGHSFGGNAAGVVSSGEHASEAIAPVVAVMELYVSKVLGAIEEPLPVWFVDARFEAGDETGADEVERGFGPAFIGFRRGLPGFIGFRRGKLRRS